MTFGHGIDDVPPLAATSGTLRRRIRCFMGSITGARHVLRIALKIHFTISGSR